MVSLAKVLSKFGRLLSSGEAPAQGLHMERRQAALAVLARHGIDAYYYVAASHCEDQELASALRYLGERGYVMLDASGEVVGAVVKVKGASEERAAVLRRRFYIVEK